jgi:hypothetical protein
MASHEFTNTSISYKGDGSIDFVVETTVDFGPPADWTGTQDEFLAKCMPARFRRWAEHFADLTEAERAAELGAVPGRPAMDPGTTDAIDYVNSQLYLVLRGSGLAISGYGGTYTYTKIFAKTGSGTATFSGVAAKTIMFARVMTGLAGVVAGGAYTKSEVGVNIVTTGLVAIALSGAAAKTIEFAFSSVAGGTATFSGAAATGVLAIPINIAASDAAGESVVSWDAIASAVSYKIYYLIGYVAETAAQIIAAPTGSKAVAASPDTVSALAAGTYGFTVTSINAAGESLGGIVDTATVS